MTYVVVMGYASAELAIAAAMQQCRERGLAQCEAGRGEPQLCYVVVAHRGGATITWSDTAELASSRGLEACRAQHGETAGCAIQRSGCP